MTTTLDKAASIEQLARDLTGQFNRNQLLALLEETEALAQPEEGKLLSYVANSEVMRKFHESPARIRSIISGNRGGKTAALCVEAAIKGTGIIPYSLRGVYPEARCERIPAAIRLNAVDYEDGVKKIVWPELRKWLPRDSIAQDYNNQSHTVRLKNGTLIEFMSYAQTIEKFGGVARDFVGFDEIPPVDVVKENMMRTIDRGGDVVYSFTPVLHEKDEKGGATNNALAIASYYDNVYLKAGRMVTADPPADVCNEHGFKWIEVFNIDVFKNVHINLDVLNEEMQTMTEQDQNVRVKGKFQHLVGLVYGAEYDEGKHLARFYEHNTDAPVYVAIDIHPNFKKYPHHVTYVSVDKGGRLFVCAELQVRGVVGELASVMEAIETKRDYWVVRRIIDPLANSLDPITGSSFAVELGRLGYPCENASKDMVGGILAVKEQLLANNLFFIDDCMGHRWELMHYVWAGHKPIDRDDHYMENLRRLVLLKPIWIDRVQHILATMGSQNLDSYPLL